MKEKQIGLPENIIAYSDTDQGALDIWCTACAIYLMKWAHITPAEAKRMSDIHVTGRLHKEAVMSNKHPVPPLKVDNLP